MEFKSFVRKPFVVQALEVTKENIAELAPMIGTLKKNEKGTPYIEVDRKKVPNVFKVFPGFWVTKMGGNVRCYTKKVFQDQFMVSTVLDQSVVKSISEGTFGKVNV